MICSTLFNVSLAIQWLWHGTSYHKLTYLRQKHGNTESFVNTRVITLKYNMVFSVFYVSFVFLCTRYKIFIVCCFLPAVVSCRICLLSAYLPEIKLINEWMNLLKFIKKKQHTSQRSVNAVQTQWQCTLHSQTCSVHLPPVSWVHTRPTHAASQRTRSPTAECTYTQRIKCSVFFFLKMWSYQQMSIKFNCWFNAPMTARHEQVSHQFRQD